MDLNSNEGQARKNTSRNFSSANCCMKMNKAAAFFAIMVLSLLTGFGFAEESAPLVDFNQLDQIYYLGGPAGINIHRLGGKNLRLYSL